MPIVEHHVSTRRSATEDPEPPLTAAELASELDVDSTRAGHVLAGSWELVRRYAPLAPLAIHREAVIRTAGWLVEQPAAAVRSESVGDISTAYAATHTSALRHSGAMALLSPWKVRRAGSIG